MGLFDFAKVCLFSEVNATVTLSGNPVAGVEVSRITIWNDKTFTDKTVTDTQGRFHFDALFSHSLMQFTPSQPVVGQKILFTYKGKDYVGWEASRRNYEINTELDGNKPINLTCELTAEQTTHDQKERRPIFGLCKW